MVCSLNMKNGLKRTLYSLKFGKNSIQEHQVFFFQQKTKKKNIFLIVFALYRDRE